MSSAAVCSQQITLLLNEGNFHACLDFASLTVGARINLPFLWEENTSCTSSGKNIFCPPAVPAHTELPAESPSYPGEMQLFPEKTQRV